MKVFTDWHTLPAAESGMRERLPDRVVRAVGAALRFAEYYHRDQKRPTGAPYLEHLLEALEIMVCGPEIDDSDVLRATVLHDILEDTACTEAELNAAFGQRVTGLVRWVTIPEVAPGQDKAQVKEACLRGLAGAPRDAKLVKLADRASNVQTLRNLPIDKQVSYYAQTVRYIVPLASVNRWFSQWYAEWQTTCADLAR